MKEKQSKVDLVCTPQMLFGKHAAAHQLQYINDVDEKFQNVKCTCKNCLV